MNSKQRLELTWIGKDDRPKLEPRILLEDAEKPPASKHRVTGRDLFDNRLIFADNLLALKRWRQLSESIAKRLGLSCRSVCFRFLPLPSSRPMDRPR